MGLFDRFSILFQDVVLDPSRVRVPDLTELRDGELLFVFLLSHQLVQD